MTKTWQVFSDGRNNFRWQQSSSSSSTQKALIKSPNSPSHHHLPSVSDVLLQGYSKLYSSENRSDNGANELHKPVVVQQSSLAKASTFYVDKYAGYSKLQDNSKVVGTTGIFQTGSGKPVAIKQSSFSKAQSMFGGLDDDTFTDTGCVKVREGSSNKAMAFSTFQNGSKNAAIGKKGYFRQDDESLSYTDREGGSFGRDNGTSSLFQTGSGKPVNIGSAGLIKARNLLGLEVNLDDDDASKGREQSSVHAKTFICHKPSTELGTPVVMKQSSLAKASTFVGYQDTGCSKLEDNCEVVGATGLFRTGSGKPVAIKKSSLSRAQSKFGGQDDDTFGDTGCLKVCDDSNNKAETLLTFQTGTTNLVNDAMPLSDWAGGSCGRDNGTRPMFQTGSTKAENKCSAGYSKVESNCKVVGVTTGMFQTGSGKPVAIKQSSLSKAQSMFGGQDDDALKDTDWTGGGGGAFGRDYGTSSMFQTGSGKAVNIGSTGLIKARSLLGLEEEENFDDASKHSRKHANGAETTFTCQEEEATPVPNSLLLKHANGSSSSSSRPPPLKFQTAGGRSVKVSADALKRARSLLGDPDLGDFLKQGDADADADALSSSYNNNMINKDSSNANSRSSSFSHGISKTTSQVSCNNFVSPLRSALPDKKNAVRLGKNLIKEFDAAEHDNDMPCSSEALTQNAFVGVIRRGDTFKNNGRTVLVDISNTVGALNNLRGEKRKLPNKKFTTPFKKPRMSNFISPSNTKSTLVSNETMVEVPERISSKRSVSTRYPFQHHRMYIGEYLGEPPYLHNMFENSPEWLRKINSQNADKYTFEDEYGVKSIGLDFFFYMLGQSGCSFISKEWTANHFRWIVWKLACYERSYPAKFSGNLLTVDNVLEELKYRYEREVNCGHKSALKRILEGDVPPSSPLILCIASIHQLKHVAESDNSSTVTSIELTDGWYPVKGQLDELLVKQVVAKKLFVGQKIRIWGARLCNWNAPVSPLEASREISLCLHINGTYRAHWADRLGFCKSGCPPLAFKCIKGFGGVVPRTLIGVNRVYPVLYREKLSNGSFLVRSERMESKVMQLYEQRRTNIVESVMSEFQWGGRRSYQVENGQKNNNDDYDDEEGLGLEKLFKEIEESDEPELIMVDMTKQQLVAFAAYQKRVEASRQSEMQKSIEKALEEAGVSKRQVDTLMRVRVVGLTSFTHRSSCSSRQGLVTIWNPTQKQQSDLVEGQAYVVAGLTPNASESHTIFMHDRGSTSRWDPLSFSTLRHYQPFFDPRKSVPIVKMGEVPLFSEFDVAGFVIYVGEVQKSGHQKMQWIFLGDGSSSSSSRSTSEDDLLAIKFRSSSVDSDSVVSLNHKLVGSTVGFCNVIKCAKDEGRNIWVAEANESSTYTLTYDAPHSKHFKYAAACADRWAKASTHMIEKLKRKVSSVVAT